MFIPGTPRPQGSKIARQVTTSTGGRYAAGAAGARRARRTVLCESSKGLPAWRAAVAAGAAVAHPDGPLDGPVAMTVVLRMPRTKAMGDRPAPPMVERPDLDKLLRGIFDGLTGPALRDDSQVIAITATKRRARPGESPGAEITLTAAGGRSRFAAALPDALRVLDDLRDSLPAAGPEEPHDA